jgi:hypothetical protein
VKAVRPSPLLSDAADVFAGVEDEVVVVGAAALEVALAELAASATRDVELVVITPTRDVDAVVETERAAAVVAHLEAADLRRSDVEHERPFTWIRGDLKIQLVRPFHPFPKPPADDLPYNPVFGMAGTPAHQLEVAFIDEPDRRRLICVNAACLLALKQAAFGRTRPHDNALVERDFHDAYLLVSAAGDALVEELAAAEHEVRKRAGQAIAALAAGSDATQVAARQMVRLGSAPSQRVAEADVRRAATRLQRRMDESG